MSVRRGENARLEAAGWTITVTSPAAAAVRLGALAVAVVSREYRALGRELRPGPGVKRRSLLGRLVRLVFRHVPEMLFLVLLVWVWQITAEQIGPLWTNALAVVAAAGLVWWRRLAGG